jgi:hypothetical protein
MTVSRNASCSDWSRIPWLRRTLRVYSRLVHDVTTLVTWLTAVSWSFTWTPRTRRRLTCSMFKHGSGSCIDFPRLPRTVKINSFDFITVYLQIIICHPLSYIRYFIQTRVRVYCWYNQVSVVGEFKKIVC